MLIWKSNIFLFIMDETPEVSGDLILDQVYISNKNMIRDLEEKGYGEIQKQKLLLKQFETLYLLYTNKLILKKNKTQINFDTYMSVCQKTNSEILTKFLIFRDLKTRGYVVKDGFGFGSDFRVYERGNYGLKDAKFIIFAFNEGTQQKLGKLYKNIEEITKMGKEPIIAVIERRGEIIYYKINKMNFLENKPEFEMKDFNFN